MFSKLIDFLFKSEKYIFWLVLIANVLLFFTTKFHPSMDGPAHLHNSYLLNKIALGSDFLSQYYAVNHSPIPNWMDHITLASLLIIFSPSMAEALMLSVYVILLALSFRYFIKQIQPSNLIASLLIFPFIYSFLFYLGFYNYCFSIGFMFLTVGYYYKNKNQLTIKTSLILSILLTLAYFSNVLGYVFSLVLIFLICLIHFYNKHKGINKLLVRELFKNLMILLIISIFSLICFGIFYFTVGFYKSTNQYKISELMDWIDDIRPIIAYNYADDKKYTQFLFSILIITFTVALFDTYQKETWKKISVKTTIWIVLILSAIGFFIVPDGASAGMMSDRLGLMFFFVLLMLVVTYSIPRKVLLLAALTSLFVQFGLYFMNHRDVIKGMSENGQKILETSERVTEKSLVLPVNMSDNWLELHMSNYIATKKEIVVLENYEASVGWFPLKWNLEKMPKILLGTKQNLSNLFWPTNNQAANSKQIDYVLLYGNTSKVNNESFKELKDELDKGYFLCYKNSDNYINLYKLK